ncbi:HpaII family restriction endonuclease [Flavobacterium turcicum]|uniref:HpaII family restriction endonuclease n=1 Tax=Flavobacterium turcicum TaxID=2764718 RepID=A0ABR7JJF2_9FLAO|nr:HpaII family restriction endonuclease [Flavobacterium turcicum]MBC5864597.1 HpaII family restriction endonuclease [Flavobacterium turcicum]NHL02644.1 HpaII family restriction endonuclease [Flavobacterium turcicum]
MLSGNKGEWSEIYALFKLLSDKQLFAGDADLKKVEELFYPIIKIIRNETGGNFEYEINGDLVIISGGKEQLRIPVKTFTEQSVKLLAIIKSSNGAFSIPEIETFMNSINCGSLKAKSTSKSDIQIVIHDQRINQTAELGFSIKSQLGGQATLLNAGKTTNFIYQISDFELTDDQVNSINEIDTKSKIKDRIENIKQLGGNISYVSLEQDVFKNNLVLIDSLLPNILAEVVKTFYTSNLSSIKDLTENINKTNPLKYDIQFAHTFYEYKIKRFLTDVALGMTPSKVWNGIYDATGGYLIVKENGDVLCYHIYNRNQFEDYLFQNTKLETASSSRHEFGKLYNVNGKNYFKLNLQIRFK